MDTYAFYFSPWCVILGIALALFLCKQLGVLM